MIIEVWPVARLKRQLKVFDYLVPDEWQNVLKPGQIVQVSFRGRVTDALVVKLKEKSEVPSNKLLPVIKIRTAKPIVTNAQFKLFTWASEYYFCSPSLICKSFLPTTPKRTTTVFSATTLYAPSLNEQLDPTTDELPANSLIHSWASHDERRSFYHCLLGEYRNNGQLAIIFPTLLAIKHFIKTLPPDLIKKLAVIHKDLNQTQYWQEWQKVLAGAPITVGTRTAAFAPYQKLQCLIIDDEASPDHKQSEQNPRFRVHDVAWYWQKLSGCRLIFSSPKPRVSTEAWSRQQLLKHLPAKNAPSKVTLSLTDIRHQATFNPYLETELADVLNEHGSALLILNRLGEAATLQCRDCGHVYHCPVCALSLAVKLGTAYCRGCNHAQTLPVTCVSCQGVNLKSGGLGLDRLSQLLKKSLPDKTVINLQNQDALHDQPQILIDTGQTIHKTFKKNLRLKLMVILNIDHWLLMPDYGAAETAWQFLARAKNFAGDHDIAKLIVQTRMPTHYALAGFIKNDDKLFYDKELKARHEFHYPPFCQLIKLIFQSPSQDHAKKEATYLTSLLKKVTDKLIIDGPYIGHPPKVRRNWRVQLAVRYQGQLPPAIKAILDDLEPDWLIDHGPEQLY